MNKAFVNENQSSGEDPADNANSDDSRIPGGKNYMTPFGAKQLQDELRKLRSTDRPETV